MVREGVFKITENCTCDCSFCDSKNKFEKILNKEVISFASWVQIADKLIDKGLEVAVISGGEPLLEAETTFRLIDYLKSKDVFTVLNTSGALFKNRRDLMRRLLNNYPDLLVFSVDSIHAEKHDSNRRSKGLWDCLVASIRQIKQTGDFPVAIRTVITKNNFRELPAIVDFFVGLGVDCIKLTNIENDLEGTFRLDKEDLDELNESVKPLIVEVLCRCIHQNKVLQQANIQKINNLLSCNNPHYLSMAEGLFSPDLIGNTPCDLGGRFMAVQSNGDILPCCEAEHHYEPLLGNLLEMTVEEITSSERYYQFKGNRCVYCQRCTQRHNLQLDFKKKSMKVNRR